MKICDAIQNLFSPYIDEEATPEEKACVDAHVEECDLCRKELAICKKQDRLIREMIGEEGCLRQFVKGEVERLKEMTSEVTGGRFSFRSVGRSRILVVEDDKQERQEIVSLLKEEEYDVRSASNGEAALDIVLKEQRFDIAIVDNIMPLMNGMEFLQALRRSVKAIPYVIWLTGFDKWSDISELNRLGVPYTAMDKAKDSKNLLGKIKEILEIHMPVPTPAPVNKLQIWIQAETNALQADRSTLRALLNRDVKKQITLRSVSHSTRFDIPAMEDDDAYIDQCILFTLAWYCNVKMKMREFRPVSAKDLACELSSHKDISPLLDLTGERVREHVSDVRRRLAKQVNWRYCGSQVIPGWGDASYCFAPLLEIKSSRCPMPWVGEE